MSANHLVTWTENGSSTVVEVPGHKDPFQIIDLMIKRVDEKAIRSSSITIQGKTNEAGQMVSKREPETGALLSHPVSSAKPLTQPQDRGVEIAAPAVAAPEADPASRQDHPSGVRATSHAAYTKLRFSGQLAEKQKEIYNHFLATPMRTWTRSELAEAMGLRMNSCTGRVSEMLDLGALEEMPEKRRCKITGETVTQLRAK